MNNVDSRVSSDMIEIRGPGNATMGKVAEQLITSSTAITQQDGLDSMAVDQHTQYEGVGNLEKCQNVLFDPLVGIRTSSARKTVRYCAGGTSGRYLDGGRWQVDNESTPTRVSKHAVSCWQRLVSN